MTDCPPVGTLVRNKGGRMKGVASNIPAPPGKFALVAAIERLRAGGKELVRLRMLPEGEECIFHPDYFTPGKDHDCWFWEIVETPDAS